MELFNNAGHLTDAGLKALMNEELDEMQRLEAAEHLSFCDPCLMRQMELMEAAGDDALQPLPTGFAEKTVKAATRKKKGNSVFLRRYVPVAAAVCLTVGLWIAGYFTPGIRDVVTQMAPAAGAGVQTQVQTEADAPKGEDTVSLGEQFNMAASQISTHFNEFFLSLRTPAEPQQATPANSGD